VTVGEARVRSVVGNLLAGEETTLVTSVAVGDIRRLAGGRNNHLYACQVGPREICVKLYRRDATRRAKHEWAALTILSNLGFDAAPEPLYYEPTHSPALAMSLLPGDPLGGSSLSNDQIRQIAEIFHGLHSIEATKLPHRLPAVRLTVEGMLHEVEERWHTCMADESSPLRKELLTRWRSWVSGPDITLLGHPSTPVFGQGDPNTSNYLWDGTRVRVIDFEYAGWSNPYYELALLVEHVQSRATTDDRWLLLEDILCPAQEDRDRTNAARALVAWYWTMEFWPHQQADNERFANQAERLLQVLRG